MLKSQFKFYSIAFITIDENDILLERIKYMHKSQIFIISSHVRFSMSKIKWRTIELDSMIYLTMTKEVDKEVIWYIVQLFSGCGECLQQYNKIYQFLTNSIARKYNPQCNTPRFVNVLYFDSTNILPIGNSHTL